MDSGIFRDIVEPCGVDTQMVNAAHVRHMSARYMLTGAMVTSFAPALPEM